MTYVLGTCSMSACLMFAVSEIAERIGNAGNMFAYVLPSRLEFWFRRNLNDREVGDNRLLVD